MAFPDALSQISTFKVTDGRVVPMTFQGSDEKERPINLNFDWQKKRVTGVAKERACRPGASRRRAGRHVAADRVAAQSRERQPCRARCG